MVCLVRLPAVDGWVHVEKRLGSRSGFDEGGEVCRLCKRCGATLDDLVKVLRRLVLLGESRGAR